MDKALNLDTEPDDGDVYVCQVCGHEDDPDRFGRYCPECGADLDELDEPE